MTGLCHQPNTHLCSQTGLLRDPSALLPGLPRVLRGSYDSLGRPPKTFRLVLPQPSHRRVHRVVCVPPSAHGPLCTHHSLCWPGLRLSQAWLIPSRPREGRLLQAGFPYGISPHHGTSEPRLHTVPLRSRTGSSKPSQQAPHGVGVGSRDRLL